MSMLVSIIIPTHNRSDLLQRALKSAFDQTYKNIEIIVVDDGSTDDTQAVLERYDNDRLVVLKNNIPKGACHARNKGIKAAKGELVTFLDDDDEYDKERINIMMAYYDPKWAYIYSKMDVIEKKGIRFTRKTKEIVTLDDMLYENSTHVSLLVSKKRLIEINYFDESLHASQDYDLALRLHESYGNAFCVQKILYTMHTEHDKPRITTSPKKVSAAWQLYKKHKINMNQNHRRKQLFYITQFKKKKPTIKKLIVLTPLKEFNAAAKYYIRQNIPWMKLVYKRIRGVK